MLFVVVPYWLFVVAVCCGGLMFVFVVGVNVRLVLFVVCVFVLLVVLLCFWL